MKENFGCQFPKKSAYHNIIKLTIHIFNEIEKMVFPVFVDSRLFNDAEEVSPL